jgi:hypothetical protein
LVAAAADLTAAHEIADGFGLDVIDASSVHDQATTSAALASAANVGLLLSTEAARDEVFVAFLTRLATQIQRAQLILVTGDARAAFPFLPEAWPTMPLEEARARSSELLRRRQAEAPPSDDTPRAEPLPPAGAAAPAPAESSQEKSAPESVDPGGAPTGKEEAPREQDAAPEDNANTEALDQGQEAESAEPQGPVAAGPPSAPPSVSAPQASPQPAPAPPIRERAIDMHSTTGSTTGPDRLGETAPADATAFAPSKLRRGTPELVRIVVHQPKDLNAVIKAAKKLDPRTESAPQGMPIGNVALGSTIGVALEMRGAAGDGSLQRRTWTGEPVDFNFAVEADASVKQVVLLARVFIDDAQIGVLAFTRKVSGPAKKPHGPGDRARLKRHKRVFLSYSSKDREAVSQIATAYQAAGIEHFWDRSSLKSGEEWHPRLRREIDRADLFHLCWSKAAADSEWVQKEAEHALTRRRKNSGKPEITVQMLDGPPWAPHPSSLDSINFDDFVRAAIVGYARGDKG